MTNKEAIFCEKSYIGETNCVDCKYYGTETCQSRESHKMAIKALEQEPCEDAISQKIDEFELNGKTAEIWIVKGKLQIRCLGVIHNIPLSSVIPQPCEDAVSRKAVINTLDNMDKALDTDRTVKNYKMLLTECYKVLPPLLNQRKVRMDDVFLNKEQMTKKEALLKELAKEDLQVLALAYVYAKNLHMYGEDVTKTIYSAIQNVEMLNKAYHKGYCDATNKKISDGGPN